MPTTLPPGCTIGPRSSPLKKLLPAVYPFTKMLAYVFWHWPRAEVTEPAYEAQLGRFHASLRDHSPQGFIGSATFWVSRANWLPVCEGSEDLDCGADFQAICCVNQAAWDSARLESP